MRNRLLLLVIRLILGNRRTPLLGVISAIVAENDQLRADILEAEEDLFELQCRIDDAASALEEWS